MKQAVLGTVVLSITLIVASILFSLDSRSIRQQEIENALEEALKTCAESIWLIVHIQRRQKMNLLLI